MAFSSRLLLVAFLALGALFLASCDDDNDDREPIPSVRVDRVIPLNVATYSDLNPRGGYVYLEDEGYRGVIVYHSLDGEYRAYERACPYNFREECGKVSVRKSGIEFECGHYEEVDGEDEWQECCGSRFNDNGTVLSGPAQRPLKEYTVVQSGDELRITN